jgi:hypothetical protein
VESLLREVKGWQNTSQLPLSEDSLKSTSSTGPDDLPKDFEDEYKHAIAHEELLLEAMIAGIQNHQQYCENIGITLTSSFHVISTPMAIIQLGFFSICQPLETVPKLRRRTKLGKVLSPDKISFPDHCKWFMDETKLQLPAVKVERNNGRETCPIDHEVLSSIRNAVTHGNWYALGLDTAECRAPKVIVLKKKKDRGIYRKVIEMTIPEFVSICNEVRLRFLKWDLVAEVEKTFKNVTHGRPFQELSTTEPSEQV